MTEAEAIKVLEKEKAYMDNHGGDTQSKALEMAIDALEKQIAKKPIVDTKSLYFYKPIPVYRCLMCNSTLERNQGHCQCGQRLKWQDSEV